MSDFNGNNYDFAAGSILGLRSWGIDKDGRLHGVTHQEVWRPDENVSTCQKERRIVCPEVAKAAAKKGASRIRPRDLTDYYTLTWSLTTYSDGPEPCGTPGCYRGTHPAEKDHTFDADCDCGFWAYNEGDYGSHGDISGIIEAYGKVTIGTRGFRAEKAKIVALSREREDDPPLRLSIWLRLQQLYPAAKFYEDFDEMVTKHGGVLKQWSEVGEDFWDRPVPKQEPYGGWTASAYTPRFQYLPGGVV